MKRHSTLPYGTEPYQIDWPDGVDVTEIRPPAVQPGMPVRELLQAALCEPIAAPRLTDAVEPGARVVIAISDSTRDDPRDAMVRGLLEHLPRDVELTIAVANGTHGPCDIGRLGLGYDLLARAEIVNHDAYNPSDLVMLGETTRGTPVRVHRCVVEADWVIATGRIKPHYFAGYGAGCKTIFPGLGGYREIRMNHELKIEARSRAGIVEGNPCRDDLEEAVAMVPSRRYLLNLVCDVEGNARLAVAGDVRQAFLAGARACEPLFKVRAPRSRVVIVSDSLPLTGSLYQASKLVAGAAGLLLDGGTMIVVAECPEGIGPLEVVNRGIYAIGLAPRLPREHRIVLVSGMAREQVEASYCEWAPSVQMALQELGEDLVDATLIPRAGTLLIEPTDRPI